MNSIEKRRHNDLAGLLFVHHFGWLRAIELGALLLPKNASSAEAANRIVRSWEKRRLVIVRELPERAGKAVVLATAGVRFLSENGHKDSSGKDLGSTKNGEWKPPASWRHDLIAAGVLVELRKRGYSVIPETSLRRNQSDATKLPDGLAKAPGTEIWIWIEVEHARKTGRNLKDLGHAIALAAIGCIKPVAGISCSAAMVAYSDVQDERGYAINHKSRVIKAVSEHAKEPISVSLVQCNLVGAGVGSIIIEKTLVEPQKALEVLRRMNAKGWVQEDFIQRCSYSGFKASVAQEDVEGTLWSWRVEEEPAGYADSLTEAKLRCAQAIAKHL